MKEKTIYITDDNSQFNTKEEALEYENLLLKIKIALVSLYDTGPLSISFANGHGFVQHPVGTKNALKEICINLSCKYLNTPKDQYGWGILGRILDDSNIRCLYTFYNKIECIDEQDREFGQVYFALHPEKAELIQLN